MQVFEKLPCNTIPFEKIITLIIPHLLGIRKYLPLSNDDIMPQCPVEDPAQEPKNSTGLTSFAAALCMKPDDKFVNKSYQVS